MFFHKGHPKFVSHLTKELSGQLCFSASVIKELALSEAVLSMARCVLARLDVVD